MLLLIQYIHDFIVGCAVVGCVVVVVDRVVIGEGVV